MGALSVRFQLAMMLDWSSSVLDFLGALFTANGLLVVIKIAYLNGL